MNPLQRIFHARSARQSAAPFAAFTRRARTVLVLAQDEARRLGQDYLGTEHLLLGLLREQEGIAGQVLAGLGLELGAVRQMVAGIVGPGEGLVTAPIHVTPRAKGALARATAEARRLGHAYLGTEHLLLALLGADVGVAASVLQALAVDPQAVRAAVHARLAAGSARG